jgi:hypothetical protein
MTPRSRRMRSREFCLIPVACPLKRAQGKPGARCTRSPVWGKNKPHERSHYRFTGNTRHPHAMVLTGCSVLSPATGLVCHRRPQGALAPQELDTSVGVSGPHDFAVRVTAVRQKQFRVHRIPRPTSVTIAIRPSCGRETGGLLKVICPTWTSGNACDRSTRRANGTGRYV